jgi:hypothetical protein
MEIPKYDTIKYHDYYCDSVNKLPDILIEAANWLREHLPTLHNFDIIVKCTDTEYDTYIVVIFYELN